MANESLTNPYVGLRPFFAEDSLYFFGRDEQVEELLVTLKETRFLAVVGSSGSGKSSLIRAGLVPSLLGGFLVSDRDRWCDATMRPGAAPLRNLAVALRRAMRQPVDEAADAALTEQLREGHTDAAVAFITQHLAPNENLFILADQFEEIFAFRGSPRDEAEAAADPEKSRKAAQRRDEAGAFVDLLLTLSERREVPLYVVLTMRTDFLGDCDVFFGLPEAMNRSQYLVPRLTRQQLRKAIQAPPMLGNVKVARRLLDQLLNDLGDRFDRLPLLQHALMRAWEVWYAAGGIGPIDQEHFEGAGGLEMALSNDADAALVEATTGPNAVPVEVVARMFKHLTDTDISQRRVRHPAWRSEIMAVTGASREAVDYVVKCFNEKRRSFLFLSGEGAADDRRADISHESLIRQWDKLRTWVDEERDARDGFMDLVKRGKAGRALLYDQDLSAARAWKAKANPTKEWAARYWSDPRDFDVALDYLGRSEQAYAEATRRRRQRKIVGRIAVGVMAVLLVYAVFQQRAAVAARERAGSTTRFFVAQDFLERDPLTAALLVKELPDTTVTNFRNISWVRQLAESPVPQMEFTGVEAAALDSSGSRIAIGDEYGRITVRRSDGTDRGRVLQVDNDDSPIDRVRFVANGTRIVSLSASGVVRLWNADSAGPPLVMPLDSAHVYSIDASDDGRHVLALTTTGRLFVWSTIGQGQLVDSLDEVMDAKIGRRHGETIAVANTMWQVGTFRVGRSADHPRWLMPDTTSEIPTNLALSDDEQLVLWITESGVTVRRTDGKGARVHLSPKREAKEKRRAPSLDVSGMPTDDEDHGSDFLSAAFSGDGTGLVTGSADGTVRAWHVATGDSIGTLFAHAKSVTDVQFSPDGSTVLSTSEDNVAFIWQPGASSERVTVRGHRAPFLLEGGASFSADGRTVLTIDEESVARVWRIPFALGSMAFGTAGEENTQTLLAGNGSGSWTVNTRTFHATLQEFTGSRSAFQVQLLRPESCARVDDSKEYVASCRGDSVVVQSMRDDKSLVVLRGHRGPIGLAAFSGDSKRLFTIQSDTARFWDRATGGLLHTIPLDGPVARVLALSHDGSRVAIMRPDSSTEVWFTLPKPSKTILSDRYRAEGGRDTTRSVHATNAVFSPDGSRLVSFDEGAVRVWRIDGTTSAVDGDPERLEEQGSGWSDAAFSHDGSRLVLIGEREFARVWNTDGVGAPLRLQGHALQLGMARWSADGRLVVTVSDDGSARVWAVPPASPTDTAQGGRDRTLSQSLELRDPTPVMDARFSTDASTVATLDAQGIAHVWLISPDSLLGRIKASTNACLSPAFRMEFLAEPRKQATRAFEKCEGQRIRTAGTKR